MDDPYRLRRFVLAQDEGATYEAAVSELRAARKTTHWMWFIFPQIAGLGQSRLSRRFAISSLGEAEAYLAHPVLGWRLIECVDILTKLTGPTAQEIFGATDAMKLRSSMTLFAHVRPGSAIFEQVLEQYFGGVTDSATEERLQAAS